MKPSRQIAVTVKFRPNLHRARLFFFGTSTAPIVPSAEPLTTRHQIVVVDPLNDHARRPGFQNVIDGRVGMFSEHMIASLLDSEKFSRNLGYTHNRASWWNADRLQLVPVCSPPSLQDVNLRSAVRICRLTPWAKLHGCQLKPRVICRILYVKMSNAAAVFRSGLSNVQSMHPVSNAEPRR